MALKVVALTEMATRRARYIVCSRKMRAYMYVYIYIDIPHDAVHHGWVMLGWFWPAKQLEDLQVQKPLFRRSLQVQTSSCTSINGVV